MRSAAEPYDADVEWLLTMAAVVLGERSALASQVAAIERGGSHGSSDPEDRITDKGLRDVGRARRLWRAWLRLPMSHREVLAAQYAAPAKLKGGGQRPVHGARAYLGDLAPLVLFVASREGALETATRAIEMGLRAKLDVHVRAALEASRCAHEAWRMAKDVEARESLNGP